MECLKAALVLFSADVAVQSRALGFAAFASPQRIDEAIGAVVSALTGLPTVEALKVTDLGI